MALSREDKADVKGAMGKALANKVSRVTKDRFSEKQNPLKGVKVASGKPFKMEALMKAKRTGSKDEDGRLRPDADRNRDD